MSGFRDNTRGFTLYEPPLTGHVCRLPESVPTDSIARCDCGRWYRPWHGLKWATISEREARRRLRSFGVTLDGDQ